MYSKICRIRITSAHDNAGQDFPPAPLQVPRHHLNNRKDINVFPKGIY